MKKQSTSSTPTKSDTSEGIKLQLVISGIP